MRFVVFEEPKVSVRENPPEVIVAPTFIDALATPKNQERLESLTLTRLAADHFRYNATKR